LFTSLPNVPGLPVPAVPLAAVILRVSPAVARGMGRVRITRGGQVGSIKLAPAPPG
jgi:hypothetical protein